MYDKSLKNFIFIERWFACWLSNEYMHQLLELKEFRAFIVSTRYEIQKHIQDKSEYDTSVPNSVTESENKDTHLQICQFDVRLGWMLTRVKFISCFDQNVEWSSYDIVKNKPFYSILQSVISNAELDTLFFDLIGLDEVTADHGETVAMSSQKWLRRPLLGWVSCVVCMRWSISNAGQRSRGCCTHCSRFPSPYMWHCSSHHLELCLVIFSWWTYAALTELRLKILKSECLFLSCSTLNSSSHRGDAELGIQHGDKEVLHLCDSREKYAGISELRGSETEALKPLLKTVHTSARATFLPINGVLLLLQDIPNLSFLKGIGPSLEQLHLQSYSKPFEQRWPQNLLEPLK